MSDVQHLRPVPAAEQPRAIDRLVVRAVTDSVGRGPTQVHTSLVDGIVLVVMRETLTKAELSLIADGQGGLVIAVRRAFQRTLAPVLIPGVETITGRSVVALLSDHHLKPDIAVETFVLARPGEPAAGDPMPWGADSH